MSEIIKLPKYLLDHKDEILRTFKNEKGADYKPETWLQHFGNNPVVAEDLSEIRRRCPNHITRRDIEDLARETRLGGYPEIRRLFLACMIWGWGSRRRGRHFTEVALTDHRAKETLGMAVSQISAGNINGAYKGFKLAGCGSAFFTKFFYFISLGYEITPLPVILDTNVAKFLEFLSKGKEWSLSTFAKVGRRKGKISSIRRYPEGYIRYVYTMHSWANELGCRADNIEYFMFKEGKKLGENIKGETAKPKSMEVKKMSEEQKGGEMDKGTRRLPLERAEDFAREKSLDKEANYIRGLTRVGGSYALREGLFMKLFQKDSKYWDEFKRRFWPNGDTNDGKKRIKRYEDLSVGFLDYLRDVATAGKLYDELGLLNEEGASGQTEKVSVQFKFNPEKMAQMENEARALSIDVPTLARIWILDRLRQLYRD